MKFSHSFRIQKDDIDEHQHVNNVAYLRWIQDVAVAHWQAAASAEQQKKYTWFVIRHEIDYKKRAFLGEEIIATTWVGEAAKVRCERFTQILRGETVLVEAKSIWCLLETETGKPSRINEELRAIFRMSGRG
ncbi:MAG: thioesterase family protein [Pyrinomonadaceae bacterium]